MTSYTMLRQCLTGVTQFRFCRGDTPIGSGSALVLPHYPLTLQLSETKLHCNRNPEITLFPGINLPITAGDPPKNWGRVIWIRHGLHRLDTPMGTFYVRQQGEAYRFLQEEQILGLLYPAQQGVRASQEGIEWETRLTLATSEPISDDLALLMLAFPLLQLGL